MPSASVTASKMSVARRIPTVAARSAMVIVMLLVSSSPVLMVP